MDDMLIFGTNVHALNETKFVIFSFWNEVHGWNWCNPRD